MSLTTFLIGYLVAWFILGFVNAILLVGFNGHMTKAWVEFSQHQVNFRIGVISFGAYLKHHFSPKTLGAFYKGLWEFNKPFTVWLFIVSVVFIPMTIIGDVLAACLIYLQIKFSRNRAVAC